MTLEKNTTQPILTIQFLKHGFDFKKLRRYALCEVTVVAFDDGEPKKKIQQAKFYNGTAFDFRIPTELYLQAVRTTLTKKVPITAQPAK